MSREQLEKVAQEHQIKNIKKFTDENLSYAILDAQAAAASLQPIEKPKAKRGRPRKNPLPEQSGVQDTKSADTRKDEKKAKPQQKPEVKTDKAENSEQKAEPIAAQGTEVKPAPKKRGRKPKSAMVQTQVETAASVEENKPESVEAAATEVTQQPDAQTSADKPVNGKEFIHAF